MRRRCRWRTSARGVATQKVPPRARTSPIATMTRATGPFGVASALHCGVDATVRRTDRAGSPWQVMLHRRLERNLRGRLCCTAVRKEICVTGHHRRAVPLPEPIPGRAAAQHGFPCEFPVGAAARYGSASRCRGVLAARYGPETNLRAVLRCGMNPRRDSSACTPGGMSGRRVSKRHCKAAWISIQLFGRGGGAAWSGIRVPRRAAVWYGFGAKRHRADAVRCECESKSAAILPCGVGGNRNGWPCGSALWVGIELPPQTRCGKSRCGRSLTRVGVARLGL